MQRLSWVLCTGCVGILVSSAAIAQVTDPNLTIPSSGLSAPTAGNSVTDPAFGVSVRRLTNRGQNGGLATAEYPQLQAVNADETRILLSTETDYRILDIASGQITHMGIELSLPRWHPMEADTLIGFNRRSGGGIQFQHVELLGGGMAMTRNVADVSATGFSSLELGSWEDASADGRYIGLIGDRNGTVTAANFDTVTGQLVTSFATGGVDWVSISPSGRYLSVQYANRGLGPTSGQVVHDAVTGQALGHVTDHHEHGDLGVDAQGNDVYGTLAWTDLCANGEAPCFSVAPLPDAIDRGTQVHLRVYDPPVGNYTTCRNHRRGGFCLSSDDYGSPGSGPFTGELWLARFGDGAVLRLAHHRSSSASYYNLVRPVLSPTGRYALFTSDWARPNASDQSDLYLIDLSPFLDTFLAGTPPPPDAGVPVDSGPPPTPDAGFDDAGVPRDAGPVTVRDSGVHRDSGPLVGLDAASVAPDAAVTTGEPRGTSGGCVCLGASPEPGLGLLVMMFGAGGMLRRRSSGRAGDRRA